MGRKVHPVIMEQLKGIESSTVVWETAVLSLDWYGKVSVGNVLEYAWQGGKGECQANIFTKFKLLLIYCIPLLMLQMM